MDFLFQLFIASPGREEEQDGVELHVLQVTTANLRLASLLALLDSMSCTTLRTVGRREARRGGWSSAVVING